jgi:hypothetical protein
LPLLALKCAILAASAGLGSRFSFVSGQTPAAASADSVRLSFPCQPWTQWASKGWIGLGTPANEGAQFTNITNGGAAHGSAHSAALAAVWVFVELRALDAAWWEAQLQKNEQDSLQGRQNFHQRGVSCLGAGKLQRHPFARI